MNKDILICGVGGQGTVLASKLLAASAMAEGNTVHSAETIGMAQRGGSVTSHVRIGTEAFSPLIPQGAADLLMAFEPAEAVRNLSYLKEGGLVLVNTAAVKPTTESLHDTGYDGTKMLDYLEKKCHCIRVDAESVCREFGSQRYFNVVMLGGAIGTGILDISAQTVTKEILNQVPQRFADINLKAFETGRQIGGTYAAE